MASHALRRGEWLRKESMGGGEDWPLLGVVVVAERSERSCSSESAVSVPVVMLVEGGGEAIVGGGETSKSSLKTRVGLRLSGRDSHGKIGFGRRVKEEGEGTR